MALLVHQLAELTDTSFRALVNDELRRQIGSDRSESFGIIIKLMTPPPTADAGTPKDPRNRAVSEALQDPLLVERWHFELCHIKRQLELQLARRKAGEQTRHDNSYPKWRVGVIGLLTSLEERITIARGALQRHLVTERAKAMEDDRDALGYRASALIAAIKRHRDTTRNGGSMYEETDADRELWMWIS